MLKSDLVQTDKHSIIILLRRKNLRFLRRTNHIQTRCTQVENRKMKLKTKYIFGITSVLILGIIGFIIYGLYLMDKEERYGDLVYFNDKVQNGDLIFRCNYETDKNTTTEFNMYGIIEKSFGKVYVWDNQNTIKMTLFKWAEKGNGERVKVFRIVDKDFDIQKAEKQNGTYNYLLNSDKIEFITENY